MHGTSSTSTPLPVQLPDLGGALLPLLLRVVALLLLFALEVEVHLVGACAPKQEAGSPGHGREPSGGLRRPLPKGRVPVPAPHLQPGGAAVQRVAPPDVAVAAVEAHMVEIVEVWLLIKPGREGPEGSRRGPGVARGRQGGAKGAAPQPRAGGVVAPCDPREPVARVMGLGAEARADDPPRGRRGGVVGGGRGDGGRDRQRSGKQGAPGRWREGRAGGGGVRGWG